MHKSKLAIHGGDRTLDTKGSPHIEWPRIDKNVEEVVVRQLHESISIYDKSGIFEDFEDAFAEYHGSGMALLSNSGTSAIFSMFEGINLSPGDEVLCPTYTFHATISPIVYTGARPIFCDSDSEGNFSLEDAKKKLTKNTKAIIVTHMWGTPIKDIDKIAKFCKENNIYLFEDCSHAHGAKIYDKVVGTFGDSAAWSLQGQKIITGGEGGIMLTNDKQIFNRALLQGHYNKRPKTEIPEQADEYKYFLTGLGLKLRAHPLAIAMALQQFEQLDFFIAQKQKIAEKFTKALSGYSFLSTPDTSNASRQASWYAYTMNFVPEAAYGVKREAFVDALIAEGLNEVDIPGSTGPIHELPLFKETSKIMPRLYSKDYAQEGHFANAQKFHESIIKLPVWVFDDELPIVDSYIEGFRKVCDYMQKNKSL